MADVVSSEALVDEEDIVSVGDEDDGSQAIYSNNRRICLVGNARRDCKVRVSVPDDVIKVKEGIVAKVTDIPDRSLKVHAIHIGYMGKETTNHRLYVMRNVLAVREIVRLLLVGKIRNRLRTPTNALIRNIGVYEAVVNDT